MRALLEELVPTLPVFGGLSAEEIEHIMGLLHHHEYAAGDVIASQGDIGSEMYIVADGMCRIDVDMGETGAPFVLAECGRGTVLGEMALIEIKPRSATIRARNDVKMFSLSNSDFLRLYEWNLHTYTLVVLNVARELSRRLRRSNGVIAACARAMRESGYKL